MRLVIAGLMLWVVASNPKEVWAWGLAAFVMLITATGMIPLLQERKKQKNLLQTLIEQEEN